MARKSQQTKSVAGSYWWVPIVVVLLAGIVGFIRDQHERTKTPGAIVAIANKIPGETVTVKLDNEVTHEATGGFVRFNAVQPGAHYLEFSASGRQTVRINPIVVKGGADNLLEFPSLPLLPAGDKVSNIAKEKEPAKPSGGIFFRQNIPEGSTLEISLSPTGSAVGFAVLKPSHQENSLSFTDAELRKGIKFPLPGGNTDGNIDIANGGAALLVQIRSPNGKVYGSYSNSFPDQAGVVRRLTILLMVNEAAKP